MFRCCANARRLPVRRRFLCPGHLCLSANASSSATAGSSGQPPPPPATPSQLRTLALYSAVPMIGFGFMDNIIMIQVGDLIDNSIGVTFGLASITAAACGQVASDTSGVLFGGVVEAACTKMGLRVPDLTKEQRQTRRAKLVTTLSAALGVIIGCVLGMTSLLFMDTHAAERAKLAAQMESLFVLVMDQGKAQFNAERASLWLYDADAGQLETLVFDDDSQVADAGGGASPSPTHPNAGKLRVRLPDSQGIVGKVARSGLIYQSADVSADSDFDDSVDRQTGFSTKSMLACPVKDQDGRVIAVVQLVNKRDEPANGFDAKDVELAIMLSRHVALFMQTFDR